MTVLVFNALFHEANSNLLLTTRFLIEGMTFGHHVFT